MSKQKWSNGNERLRENFEADPQLAARVEEIRKEMAAEDRAYAMTLAMIRRAVGLTQVALAESLKTSQSAVARTEQRPDMLLSTLHSYLAAAGAKARIIVELADGRSVEVSLEEASKNEARASTSKQLNERTRRSG
jgi:transcriptional regulator with XRE-family HTH domain